MKTTGRAAALVLAVGAALAACGDDDSSGGGGTGGTAPTGCAAAIEVTDPGTVSGDTRGQVAFAEASCIVGDAPEAYFTVTPTVTGMLDLTLESDADLGMYVRSTCDDADSERGCADMGQAGEVETLSVPVTAGEPVFVIVDGFDDADAGPFTLSVQSRAIECGDGKVEGAEQCDPPDGTTCAADCQIIPEICDDGADNDLDGFTDCEDASDCGGDAAACPLSAACGAAAAATGSDAGDASTGAGDFAGSCTGGSLSHEALYTYAPPSAGALLVTLQSATNQGVYVRGECADPATELGCLDDQPGGADEALVVPVPGGGAVTIFVDAATPADSGPFTLLTSFEPSTEAEPNDTPASGTVFADPYVGTVDPAGDVDHIKVAVPGPSSTLTVDLDDLGNGDCANFKLDSIIDILGENGATVLGTNDDAGDFCSRVEVTGLVAGVYFVRVGAAEMAVDPTFAYRLTVQIN